MNINQLDDYALSLVLDQLPLADFVLLELVCKRWQMVQQSLCIRKKHLSLFNDKVYRVPQYTRFQSISEDPYHHIKV